MWFVNDLYTAVEEKNWKREQKRRKIHISSLHNTKPTLSYIQWNQCQKSSDQILYTNWAYYKAFTSTEFVLLLPRKHEGDYDLLHHDHDTGGWGYALGGWGYVLDG